MISASLKWGLGGLRGFEIREGDSRYGRRIVGSSDLVRIRGHSKCGIVVIVGSNDLLVRVRRQSRCGIEGLRGFQRRMGFSWWGNPNPRNFTIYEDSTVRGKILRRRINIDALGSLPRFPALQLASEVKDAHYIKPDTKCGPMDHWKMAEDIGALEVDEGLEVPVRNAVSGESILTTSQA